VPGSSLTSGQGGFEKIVAIKQEQSSLRIKHWRRIVFAKVVKLLKSVKSIVNLRGEKDEYRIPHVIKSTVDLREQSAKQSQPKVRNLNFNRAPSRLLDILLLRPRPSGNDIAEATRDKSGVDVVSYSVVDILANARLEDIPAVPALPRQRLQRSTTEPTLPGGLHESQLGVPSIVEGRAANSCHHIQVR
jgi:hypothetical protein